MVKIHTMKISFHVIDTYYNYGLMIFFPFLILDHLTWCKLPNSCSAQKTSFPPSTSTSLTYCDSITLEEGKWRTLPVSTSYCTISASSRLLTKKEKKALSWKFWLNYNNIAGWSSQNKIDVTSVSGTIVTPPRNRGGVIFLLQFVCLCVCVCLSVCPFVNKMPIEPLHRFWCSLC